MLISNDLKSLLHQQWIEEKENSQFYLYIGAWLKNFGLDNIGKFFMKASDEEEGHAQEILKLMTDLNIDFESGNIASGQFSINSIMDIAEKFLSREIQTTESLKEIRDACEGDEAGNAVVEEMIRKMISQQQSELEEANNFMDKSKIMNGDWKFILLWDSEEGE